MKSGSGADDERVNIFPLQSCLIFHQRTFTAWRISMGQFFFFRFLSFILSLSLSFFLSFFLLFLSFLSSVSSIERAFDGHRFTLGLCSWGRRYIGPLLMYTSEPRWKTKGAFHHHPGHRRWFFSFLVNLHFAESRWTFSLLVVAQYVSWWHTSLLRKTS